MKGLADELAVDYLLDHQPPMKNLVALIYFAVMASAIAQGELAPLPSVIIICTTNQSAPVTVIHTSSDSWREDDVKHQSVITNLNLTCMSAKSVSSQVEKDTVVLVLHDATSYGPTVVAGKYGEDQKLQTVFVKKLSLSLEKTQFVQVNGEILSASRFAQKFKVVPEERSK